MKNVAIIGQGKIGSAIAHILKDKKNITLRTWDADPEKPRNVTTCETAVIDADLIIVAIPTRALLTSFSTLQTIIPKNTIVITVAKGMAGDPPQFVAEILSKHFGPSRVGILSGPMLAEELFSGKVGEALIAGDGNVGEQVLELFEHTQLQVIHTKDFMGVSVAGVLKNIYAVGIGMVEGLGIGANARGMFFGRAIGEMQNIIISFEGNGDTVLSAAGIGDLIATGTSGHSTNYTYGKNLALGKSVQQGEGALAAASLLKRIKNIEQYPLLRQIISITLGKRSMASFKKFYEH